ncbi:ABC transporter permease [Thermogladius sp. 4427co]|uniref:ABC transporter permease n=1 Tax=Thermogladius sp. 4427co TaxID=3450718 RepID=UPI003F79155E
MSLASTSLEYIAYFSEIVLAIIIGLAVGAVVMWIGGYDPWQAYYQLFVPSLTTPYGIYMTLSFATPIILTGLTFAIGVRAGLFNIGAEGQMYMGALGAVLYGAVSLPFFAYLPMEFLTGILLAVLWGFIAGWLKAYKGVNEVVSTIMLNWIAYWIVETMRVYVIPNPIDASKTVSVPPSGRLPLLIPNTELSVGYIIAVLAAVLMYFILWKTVIGYEIRVVGYNPTAARYAGINVRKVALYSFILGGVTSGLAGVCEVAGRPPSYAITTGLSNLVNLGFDGLTVSLVGANHPLGIILSSILIGAMKAGSRNMQIFAHVPLEMVQTVQGIIIIALSVPGVVRLIIRRIRR